MEDITEHVKALRVIRDGKVEFKPSCEAALRKIFDWFDVKHDDALDFEEFSALFKFMEHENLSPDYFHQLGKFVETKDNGALSFKGFIDLYKLTYSDAGEQVGDSSLWKDLRAFGFDHDLNCPDAKKPALNNNGNKQYKNNPDEKGMKKQKRDMVDVLGKQKEPVAEAGKKRSRKTKSKQKDAEWMEIDSNIRQGMQSDERNEVVTMESRENNSKEQPKVEDRDDEPVVWQPRKPVETNKAPPLRNAFSLLGKKKKVVAEKRDSPDKNLPEQHKQAAQIVNTSGRETNEAIVHEIVDVVDLESDVKDGKKETPKRTRPLVNDLTCASPSPPAPKKRINYADYNPFFRPRTSKEKNPDNSHSCDDVTRPNYSQSHWSLLAFPLSFPVANEPLNVEEDGVPIDWDHFILSHSQTSRIEDPSNFPMPKLLSQDMDRHKTSVINPYVTVQSLSSLETCEAFQEVVRASPISQGVPTDILDAFIQDAWQGDDDSTNDLLWSDKYRLAIWKVLRESMPVLQDVEQWLQDWTVPKPIGTSQSNLSNLSGDYYYSEDNSTNSSWAGGVDVSGAAGVLTVLGGPSSANKTQAVYSMAETLGYQVIEAYPGLLRSGTNLKQLLGEASQSKVIGPGRNLNKSLLLIDEVDNVFDDDKGFFQWLRATVKTSRCPVLLTCNQVPLQVQQMIEENCAVLHKVPRPHRSEVLLVLQSVMAVQGIHATPQQAEHLADIKSNSIRACLQHLQFFCRTPENRAAIVDLANTPSPTNEMDRVCLFPPLPTERDIHELWDEFGLDSDAGESNLLLEKLSAVLAVATEETLLPCSVAPPLVSKVEPARGDWRGGTLIKVIGSGFAQESVVKCEVSIGGNPCSQCEILSDNLIQAVTPPLAQSSCSHHAQHLEQLDERKRKDAKKPKQNNNNRTNSRYKNRGTVGEMEDDEIQSFSDDDELKEEEEEEEELDKTQRSPDASTSSSSDDDDDFVTPKTKKKLAKKPAKKPKTYTYRPTPGYKLAVSRPWPRNVQVDLVLSSGLVASSLSHKLCPTNGAFEYSFEASSTSEDNRATSVCIDNDAVVKKSPLHQTQNVHLRSSEVLQSQANVALAWQLFEIMSECNLVFNSPVRRQALRDVNESFRTLEDAHMERYLAGASLIPCIRASVFELADHVFTSPEIHASQQDQQCKDNRWIQLQEKRRKYFHASLQVALTGLSSFALGSSRGTGFANNKKVHPALQEYVPFLRRMFFWELHRKANKPGRRFFHYFSRFPRSGELLEAIDALESLDPRIGESIISTT